VQLTKQQKLVFRLLVDGTDLLPSNIKQLRVTLRSLRQKGLLDELNQPTEKALRMYDRILYKEQQQ
jgi:hypothetical protein